jgi:hypothetical protein
MGDDEPFSVFGAEFDEMSMSPTWRSPVYSPSDRPSKIYKAPRRSESGPKLSIPTSFQPHKDDTGFRNPGQSNNRIDGLGTKKCANCRLSHIRVISLLLL